MTLSIAVIGCGWVSNARHGPAYQEYAASHPSARLSACCDLDAQRAEDFRDQFGFARAYRDPFTLLEHERPDVICLNVPPEVTCALGGEILRRGIPLLSEKPPGLNRAEIDRLISAADRGGAPHQVAFNRRYMPLATELRARLADSPVEHVAIQMARVDRRDDNFATTAIHSIDTARFLAGSDFAHLRIHYQELPWLGPQVANFTLDGIFENGTTAQLSFQPCSGADLERSQVYARDQVFLWDVNTGLDVPGRLRHFRAGQLAADLDAIQFCGRSESYFLNGFYQEDAAFFDALSAGRPPLNSFRACRQSVEIMESLSTRAQNYP